MVCRDVGDGTPAGCAEARAPQQWSAALAPGGPRHAGSALRRAEEHVELVDPRLEPDQLGTALEQEVLAEAVAPVHLEREAPEVAQLLLAQPHERAPLPPQGARGWSRPAPRPRLPAQQAVQGGKTRHGRECTSGLGVPFPARTASQSSTTTRRSSVSSRTAYAGPSRVFPESFTPP